MNTIQVLKEEITTDPLGIGYGAMSSADILASLQAKTRTKNKPIPSSELLAWMGGNARLVKLLNASNTHASDAIKSICLAALELVKRDGTAFDFSAPGRGEMLDALVANGVFSADDRTEALAMATESTNRLDELKVSGRIAVSDIDKCRG